jgi:hypothetical protein
MSFIGHANEPIHRIYQRLRTSDLKACLNSVVVGEDTLQSYQNPNAPSITPGIVDTPTSAHDH